MMDPSPELDPPICYMGHYDCYDRHESERRADEADWEAERLADLGPLPSFLQEPARAWEKELREKGLLD